MFTWLSEAGFMPHGHCFLWRSDILWLHVLSDATIALAYFSIPVTLVYFLRKRPDIPFRGVFWLFAAFIMLCGITHVFGIVTIWRPLYALDGIIKAMTASTSILTALALIPLVPMVLKLRSPADLELANRQLMLEVQKRTVAEKQSEHARDEALSASRAKSEFVANMSHEIRTPMNGVIGMTGALLDTDMTPRQKEIAETIRFSAEALLGIINDVLDFSKVEAGMMQLELVETQVTRVVERAMDILSDRARAKELEMVAFFDPGVPAVLRGDPGRLHQVLTNLLANAVKFTERGEVVVRVSLEQQADDFTVLRFTVRDTGIGIKLEAQKRLFLPFSQADSSTTRRYGGTGLGLVISKQLVELMGGHIGVDSEPGRGSSFWFTSRFENCPAAAAAPERPPQLQRMRALFVDDSATTRKALTERMRAWGMRVEEAPDGPAALESLKAAVQRGAPFDVAIIDQRMPQMDGLELARRIQEQPALASTHVVLLQAQRGINEAATLQRAGVMTLLTKPIRTSDFYNTLNALAEAPHAQAESSAPAPPSAEMAVRAWRILVAEDNPVNQMVARHQLAKLGLEATFVDDGRQAVDAVINGSFDVVLMDCQMPVLDGYEATAEIRRREGPGRHVWIVAMTAHAMPEDRQKCLMAGMDDYLSKPVTTSLLRGALAALDGRAKPAI